MSLLDLFVDMDITLDRVVNDGAGNLADATVDELRAKVRAQRSEIIELCATVGVLINLLREAGVVDGHVLKYRVEAALAEQGEAAEAVL